METPFLIWFTGISGSGKTTLSRRLHKRLKKTIKPLILLDGDDIRVAFGSDLGYDVNSRILQINRIQNIAKILVNRSKCYRCGSIFE